MNLDLKNITFIIVTYKSETIIHDCLDTLPKECKKIVIENSNNINLQNQLLSKYDNIEVILSENIGMGCANNIGLQKTITEFAFIINPDASLKKDTLSNIFEAALDIDDFAIISPINSNVKYLNYKIFSSKHININENVISVDVVDGFSMLLNLKKFSNKVFFDENIFLYLENDDLCRNLRNRNEKVYVVKNSLIDHKGGKSSEINIDYLRQWHWMWSKFYFNKKHYGFHIAIFKVFFNFSSALIKYFVYSILFNNHKKKIYKMRLCGLLMSMLGKSSYLRPKD